jgi:aminoglycoside/choline kinase family phosphotransferase
MTGRSKLIDTFLERAGWGGSTRYPLVGDASFRRYERLKKDGETSILMDAPSPNEDTRPFIKITKHLLGLGYSAPKIMAQDTKEGFLLIEDLGDDTYTNALSRGYDERELYQSATDLLIDLHSRELNMSEVNRVPNYDTEMLIMEASLLTDWYCTGIQKNNLSRNIKSEFLEIWGKLIKKINTDGQTLVLRDFHADNLIWLSNRSGVQKCGLLDYQDAVIGSPAYDLMSLLQDARRDLRPGLSSEILEYYYKAFPKLDLSKFKRNYLILAAQRHCKVIGIFSRLAIRDHKYGYLDHLPRCWRMLEQACSSPELRPLKEWLDKYIPPIDQIILTSSSRAR